MKLKGRYITFIIILFLGIAAILFVYNDSFLYDTTVARVVSVKNSFSHVEEGPDGEEESYYDQLLTVEILNGGKKGDMLTLNNTYTDSGVNDERYYKGSQLLTALNGSGDSGSILGKKRDVYVVLFFVLFVLLLAAVSGKHGMIVLVSFIVNLTLLLAALNVYDRYG